MFQFNDDGIIMIIVIFARDNHVYPFRCIRNTIFDSNSSVVWNTGIAKYFTHAMQRILPRMDFTYAGVMS